MLNEAKYNLQDAQTVFDAVCADLMDDPCWQESLNLKLPDVSYYCDKIIKKYANDHNLIFIDTIDNVFHHFCEDMYSDFKEFLEDEKIDESIMHYIGSTSSFKLTNLYAPTPYQYSNILHEIMPEIYCVDSTSDGQLYCCEWENQDFGIPNADYYGDLEDIVLHLQDDMEKYITKARMVYVHIVDFKKNELEYFKEWLDGFREIYFEERVVPYANFPLNEIEKCIEDIKKWREYTCKTKEDMIVYSKLEQIEEILKGA